MAQLRQDYQEYLSRGAEVIAVGPEDQLGFSEFWEKENMPFPGVPDHSHKVANLYQQKVDLLKLGRMPAMVIVDKKGKIRYRHYGDSMSDIPDDSEILSILDELNKESI
jgi:peroxiredoxin